MDVIKKSDILDSYNYDNYSGSEIIGMIVYGEIPTIKAIPLERIKEFRNYITKVNDMTLIQKLNELIESEE